MAKVLIGGMGRSGTSFLSKMFSDLNCNISTDADYIDSCIAAGIEVSTIEALEFINSARSGIAKTPFLYEICHSMEFNSSNVDLIIIPLRDPWVATMSRLANEMQSQYFSNNSLKLQQSFGVVNAGCVYHVDASEELKQLSACLATLLYQCCAKGIRVSLVPFPEIGRVEVQRAWIQSIDDILERLGVSSPQACTWLLNNFNEELANKNYSLEISEDAEKWKAFMQESLPVPSNTSAFVMAHDRYLANKSAELKQARTEAEQARTEAEQASVLLSRMTNSKIWQATRPIRKALDAIRLLLRS